MKCILSDLIHHSHQSHHCIYAQSCYRGPVCFQNIARGTMDQEIDSVTWIELGNNMSALTLVANLANRWQRLH